MNAQDKSTQRENTETVLIIEDDRSLREGLAMNFHLQGYTVLTADDGEDGMAKAFDARVDIIILDIMLPVYSGLEILSELREKEKSVPVLVLSARGTTDNKIESLRMGADDYVTKPFDLRELIARAEVMLRRRRAENSEREKLKFGDVVVDLDERRVMIKGEEVALSRKEFDLLCLLAGSPGRPFTRDTILDRVWGWGFDGTARTVDNFIVSLRKKIESDPAKPRHIQTVRQVGYRLES